MSILLALIRRIVRWSVSILAILCILWVMVCIEERWRGKRAWNAYRSAAMARGVELELADLKRAPVSDEENFAAAPMIRDLFIEVPGGASTKWFQALNLERPPPSQRGRRGKGPDLVYWRDHFVRQRVIAAATDSPAEDVLHALEVVRPELDALREAGKRPKSRFPTQWERGFGATLPHAGPLLKAAQVEELAIAARLAKGDSPGAYTCVREMLRLYEALRDEHTVYVGLWRVGILARLNAVVRDGLLANNWAEPELQKLSRDFAQIDLLSDWRFAVSTERICVNTNFDVLQQKSERELMRQAFAFHSLTWCGTAPAAYFTMCAYPRGWLFLSRAKINEYFDRQIARIDAIKSGVPLSAESDIIDELAELEEKGTVFDRIIYFVALLSRPPLPGIRAEYLRTGTQIGMSRVACELARYEHRNGSFPDFLANLVPEFLSETPRDLMDGAPLRYRGTESGYDLWSIGRVLKDDGGKLPNDSTEPADWVFHLVSGDDDQ